MGLASHQPPGYPMLYSQLFESRRDVYALARGDSYHPVWQEWGKRQISDHVGGRQSVGIYLLRQDNQAHLLAFDFDRDDEGAVKALCNLLLQTLPDTGILVERTGGRGWHVWVFLAGWMAAGTIRAYARMILDEADLPYPVEIYPKQDNLEAAEGGLGNLIRLPLGKHPRTGHPGKLYNAYLLEVHADGGDPDLPVLPVAPALLEEIVRKKIGGLRQEDKHNGKGGHLPCIQKFQEGVDEGYRDEAMFRLAAYLYRQQIPQEAALVVMERANASSRPPMDRGVIRAKVRSAYRGEGYGLPCSSQLVGLDSPFCDSACPVYTTAKARRMGLAATGWPRLVERDGRYVLQSGDLANPKEVILSNFTLQVSARVDVVDEGMELLRVRLNTFNGAFDMDLPVMAFNSRQNMFKYLPRSDVAWFGTDVHCQMLKAWLMTRAQIPLRRGHARLGRVDTSNIWITGKSVYAQTGPEETTEWEYHRPVRFGQIDIEIMDDPTMDVPRVLATLPRLHDLAAMARIIGWTFAVPYKPFIMRSLGHFPLMMLFGTRGGGKTQLVQRVVLPLFGYSSFEPRSQFCDSSKFIWTSFGATTTTVPVFFDEYRPSAMNGSHLRQLWDQWRHLYTGDIDYRGQSDLSQMAFRQTTPVILAGEEMIEDPALIERVVQIPISPASLTEATKQSFLSLPDLQRASYYFLMHSLKQDFYDLWKEAAGLVPLNMLQDLPPRMQDMVMIIALGLVSWARLCQLDLTTEMLHILGRNQPGFSRTGGYARTMLWSDHFLLDVADMIKKYGPSPWGDIFRDSEGHEHMFISLRSAYAEWCKEIKRRGGTPTGLDSLRRQMSESSFVYPNRQRRMPGGLNTKVWQIDLDALGRFTDGLEDI